MQREPLNSSNNDPTKVMSKIYEISYGVLFEKRALSSISSHQASRSLLQCYRPFLVLNFQSPEGISPKIKASANTMNRN